MKCQSMFDTEYRMLGAGAWGWSREMICGGKWEGGTHVHPWLIHVNVWQNQYSIIKQNEVKIKIKKKKPDKIFKIRVYIIGYGMPTSRFHYLNFSRLH